MQNNKINALIGQKILSLSKGELENLPVVNVETSDFTFTIRGNENSALSRFKKKEKTEKVLTVVCNKGVHPIPFNTLPGEVFVATEGSLPMGYDELRNAVTVAVRAVAEKIMEAKPQKVFLVPSGLPVVLSQLQALCMQMISKPAVILQWDRDRSEYFEINVIPRDVLTS